MLGNISHDKHQVKNITKWFVLSKIIQYTIIYFTPNINSQFDTSTSILLDTFTELDQSRWFNKDILNKLLSWDAVYYLKNILHTNKNNGLPEYENDYAFSPFVWCLLLKKVLLKTGGLEENPYILLTIVSFTNLLHYFATIQLFHLTKLILNKNSMFKYKTSKVNQISLLSSLLFIFSSAAGFQATFYSEQLSALLVFAGLYCREHSITYLGSMGIELESKMLYLLSSLLFTIATCNRPNCIIVGIFYLWDLYKLVFISKRGKQGFDWKILFFSVFSTLVAGGFMLLGVLAMNYYIPYRIFCTGSDISDSSWCKSTIVSSNSPLSIFIPQFFTKESLYTHIQTKYWNVGFLKYYTPNNIPNILFAVPNIVCFLTATFYFHYNFNSFNMIPYCYMGLMFLFVICGWAHIQIINRVITFIPLHLWFVSLNYLDTSPNSNFYKLSLCYMIWMIVWWPLQTILFVSFLPPA